ncbi:MAG TPA: NAD(P)H-dependent oxidoreductase [Ramlibacter sp.]|nr:NAD(P)H-dependent oxidoreductase [Ramlibacter sp.]
MKCLIVHASPEPASFTSALKDAARARLLELGHEVAVSDLYAEGFNPVAGRHDFLQAEDEGSFHYQREQLHASQGGGFSAEIQREQQRVAEADLYLFTYPLWWGGMPAILKGWFDRVMAYGFAYADGQRFSSGWFQGRHALIGLTTGGTAERFSPEGVYGPIETLLYPHRRTMLEYLGLTVHPAYVAYAAPRVADAQREHYLRDWQASVQHAADAAAVQAVRATQAVRAVPVTHWATAP